VWRNCGLKNKFDGCVQCGQLFIDLVKIKWYTSLYEVICVDYSMRQDVLDVELGHRNQSVRNPESARTYIPDDEITGDHLVEYTHEAPPVFFGHYWMEGKPEPLARNIACLDYSVAKLGGDLTAYRWNGEQVLTIEGFVWVDRVEGES